MTDLTFSLLRLLADGQFHSGARLADQFGCSRSAVWHHVRRLRALELDVIAIPNRGYRLSHRFDALDPRIIEQRLKTANSRLRPSFVDQTGSTNDDLLALVKAGERGPLVRFCEFQTAGRGRQGRRWRSGLGHALTFSMLWRFDLPIAEVTALPLAVGVSLVNSLSATGVDDVSLKWPNDLIASETGAKIGGILIEAQGDVLGPSTVVVGVGINVHRPPTDLSIDAPHTHLDELSSSPLSRNELLARMAIDLEDCLTTFESHRFAPFQAAWNQRNLWQNREVEAILPTGQTVVGRCEGVDDRGNLCLTTDGLNREIERFRLVSGEVRLKTPDFSQVFSKDL